MEQFRQPTSSAHRPGGDLFDRTIMLSFLAQTYAKLQDAQSKVQMNSRDTYSHYLSDLPGKFAVKKAPIETCLREKLDFQSGSREMSFEPFDRSSLRDAFTLKTGKLPKSEGEKKEKKEKKAAAAAAAAAAATAAAAASMAAASIPGAAGVPVASLSFPTMMGMSPWGVALQPGLAPGTHAAVVAPPSPPAQPSSSEPSPMPAAALARSLFSSASASAPAPEGESWTPSPNRKLPDNGEPSRPSHTVVAGHAPVVVPGTSAQLSAASLSAPLGSLFAVPFSSSSGAVSAAATATRDASASEAPRDTSRNAAGAASVSVAVAPTQSTPPAGVSAGGGETPVEKKHKHKHKKRDHAEISAPAVVSSGTAPSAESSAPNPLPDVDGEKKKHQKHKKRRNEVDANQVASLYPPGYLEQFPGVMLWPTPSGGVVACVRGADDQYWMIPPPGASALPNSGPAAHVAAATPPPVSAVAALPVSRGVSTSGIEAQACETPVAAPPAPAPSPPSKPRVKRGKAPSQKIEVEIGRSLAPVLPPPAGPAEHVVESVDLQGI